jgi:hypothetical protein
MYRGAASGSCRLWEVAMTDADDRLRGVFAEDLPPARDADFSAEVMGKVMRRRFLADLGVLSGISAAGGLALWAPWPSLAPLLTDVSQGLVPVAACLALAATTVAVLDRRLSITVGFES